MKDIEIVRDKLNIVYGILDGDEQDFPKGKISTALKKLREIMESIDGNCYNDNIT